MSRLERLTAKAHEHGLGAPLVPTPANAYSPEPLPGRILRRAGRGCGVRRRRADRAGPSDHTPPQAGMMIPVEPGLYVAGGAGIRHADRVRVTAPGAEILTPHPRDTEALVVRA